MDNYATDTQPTIDERAREHHNNACTLLSKDSYDALNAACQRLWGTTFAACIRRAVAAPWRPSTSLPDAAMVRVALDLLGVTTI